jgi:OmpA-OmpF porin, OOP family
MRIKQLLFIAGVTGALMLAPLGSAQAARSGLYFGGSYGLYDIKEVTLDEQDTFWKAFLGAQFTDWFGLEVGYVDFNRATEQNSSFESDGLSAAAVLSLPLGPRSALYGKVGQFWWDAATTTSGVQTTSDSSDAFWGAGLKFGLSDAIGLRVEYERYDVFDIDLDAVSVGLQVTF